MKPTYEIYGGRPVWETASGHPWVTLVLVVFAPVAILVLSCLYRSHNPFARLWGSDQGLPWRQVAVSVDHGARLIMVLVSATGQPPNPDRYTTCSNQ